MKRILCIYNTCGISGKDNTDYYISAIESILGQNFDGFHVVLSSCLNSEEQINKLKSHFGHYISYNIIHEKFTVDQTFNHTVYQCVDRFGPYQGYLFIDSGVKFPTTNILSELYKLLRTDEYGMVAAQSDDDTGFGTVSRVHTIDEDYIVPLGDSYNLHCQIFHHDILKKYKRVLVDIFESFCTESIFSFVNAAIKKKWIISSQALVHHEKSIDGASSGFVHGHDRLFRAKQTIFDILNTPEGWECGIGYESFRGIRSHNPDMFDKNGYAITSKLYIFIKNNFFLKPEQLDYTQIKHEFIS